MENENKSQEKIYVDQVIFSKQQRKPFTWADIKHLKFEDEDRIDLSYVEGFYSENNSYDEHFSATVTRKVLETDQQFEKRQKRIEQDKKWARERRYENFLRLKQEFEPAEQTEQEDKNKN